MPLYNRQYKSYCTYCSEGCDDLDDLNEHLEYCRENPNNKFCFICENNFRYHRCEDKTHIVNEKGIYTPCSYCMLHNKTVMEDRQTCEDWMMHKNHERAFLHYCVKGYNVILY